MTPHGGAVESRPFVIPQPRVVAPGVSARTGGR
jgi:hypothetical protein